MTIELCDKRKAIIAQTGHLLVLGGPGSGKTTIALFKAQRRFSALKLGQEFLFLSFSRAAIRQVLPRCKEILTPAERRAVTVQTYHAFCMEMLESMVACSAVRWSGSLSGRRASSEVRLQRRLGVGAATPGRRAWGLLLRPLCGGRRAAA